MDSQTLPSLDLIWIKGSRSPHLERHEVLQRYFERYALNMLFVLLQKPVQS